jgi:RNA polymerase sigma-70 factor (ECF subfamily)
MLVGDTAAVRFVKKTLRPCYETWVPSSELAALAQRAQSGDAAARHELLVELYRSVRKHVYLVIGAGPIAEDAVQETMIALDRGLAAFRGDASPRTWALAIATRTARRLRRRESRYQLVEDGIADTAIFDLAPAASAELAVLQRALATLAPKKRDAFVLMAIGELTAEEAGAALGTFSATAASRYRHARTELKQYFERRNFDEPEIMTATTEELWSTSTR